MRRPGRTFTLPAGTVERLFICDGRCDSLARVRVSRYKKMNAGTGPTLLSALYLNLCILTTSALLVGLTFRMPSRHLATFVKAAVFAATSVTLFLNTFPAGPHLFVDLRLVPVALAAYRLGPVWALVTALPVLLYRISLGGPALPGAVAHLALVLLAASLLRHRDVIPSLSPMENARRALLIFGLPTLTIFPTFAQSNLPVTAALVPYLLVVTGSMAGFVLWYAIVRLMAQTFERAARFEEAASLDVLTGLPNRLAFEQDAAPAAPGRYLLFLASTTSRPSTTSTPRHRRPRDHRLP